MSLARLLFIFLSPLIVLLKPHISLAETGTSDSISIADEKLEKVTIAQFGKEKFLLYLPIYLGMEEGLFRKRGIDINLKFAGNDDQIFASVVSGSALFGIGDPVFAAIAKEKGGPGKIVALMITKLGLSGYTNKPEVPIIKEPRYAAGLRFGSLPSPSTTFRLLTEFINQNSLGLTGTKIFQVAIGSQMAALESGNVDVAVDLEPAVSIAEAKGYRVVFALDKHSPSQAITGLSTLESTISNKPQIIQKVVSGLQESLKILHNDRERAISVAKRLFPTLKEPVIRNATERMLQADMYPKTTQVIDELWQRTLKTRLDSGELKHPQATEMTVDNRFADIAAEGN